MQKEIDSNRTWAEGERREAAQEDTEFRKNERLERAKRHDRRIAEREPELVHLAQTIAECQSEEKTILDAMLTP